MPKIFKATKTFALILLLFTILQPSIAQAQNENYGDRIRACVQPNVFFTTSPPKDSQNPSSQYRIKLNPNGTISTVDLTKSSGNTGFDAAVQKGILACKQFPKPTGRDYPTYLDINYNMYDANGSSNTRSIAATTVTSAANMKQGFTYKFYKDGSCRPDTETICLTADEYKKFCSIAKSVTQYSIKLRAVGASQTEKVLLEGGNYEKIKVLWAVSGGGTEHCYAVITASGIVNGNSARADIEGIVTQFIKADSGSILVSSFHLF
jgi:TonB family protein